MPRRRDTGAARRLLAGAALLWLVTAAGCAGAPVAVDFDPQVEFLFYRTFVWLGRVGEPAGEPESLPESRIHRVVADALASHGITEGDPATADLAVRYRTGVRTEVIHTPMYIDEPGIVYGDPRPDRRDPHDRRDRFDGGDQPDRGSRPDGDVRPDGRDHPERAVRPGPTVVIPYHTYIYVDRTRYFVGTLTIELIDRKQRRVVWEGTTSETATDRAAARRPTPDAAARIMAAFPPMHR